MIPKSNSTHKGMAIISCHFSTHGDTLGHLEATRCGFWSQIRRNREGSITIIQSLLVLLAFVMKCFDGFFKSWKEKFSKIITITSEDNYATQRKIRQHPPTLGYRSVTRFLEWVKQISALFMFWCSQKQHSILQGKMEMMFTQEQEGQAKVQDSKARSTGRCVKGCQQKVQPLFCYERNTLITYKKQRFNGNIDNKNK